MNALRLQALAVFKTLHRTRLRVFDGDPRALNAARERINSEFRKNASVNNTDEIRKLIKFGEATNEYLRRAIVQAVPTERGNLRLRLRPENMQTTLPGDECDELAAELGLRTPDLSSKKKTPGEPSAAPKKSKKAKII